MDMYFRGKKVLASGGKSTWRDNSRKCWVSGELLYLDGEVLPFRWRSDLHEHPTTEVPRAYRKHINLRILEDMNHDS